MCDGSVIGATSLPPKKQNSEFSIMFRFGCCGPVVALGGVAHSAISSRHIFLFSNFAVLCIFFYVGIGISYIFQDFLTLIYRWCLIHPNATKALVKPRREECGRHPDEAITWFTTGLNYAV